MFNSYTVCYDVLYTQPMTDATQCKLAYGAMHKSTVTADSPSDAVDRAIEELRKMYPERMIWFVKGEKIEVYSSRFGEREYGKLLLEIYPIRNCRAKNT